MASRARIAHIARRIEGLKPNGQLTLVVWDDTRETQEQALANYEKSRGIRVRGPVVYIITGVPRGGRGHDD